MWSLFKKTQSSQWVNRDVRVSLLSDMKMKACIDGISLNLLNISLKGMAVNLEKGPVNLSVGAELQTEVIVDDKKLFTVMTKIRHVTDDALGLEVVSNLDEFSFFVGEFFSSEINALAMKEVNQESVKQDPRGNTRWWNGGEDYDFYLVEKDSSSIFFNLSFQGQVIVGGEGLNTVIGDSDNYDERFKGFAGSELVKDAKPLDDNLKKSLEKFFKNIPNLSDAVKESLIKSIQ